MTDRDRLRLRGPVERVETEFAELDPLTEEWAGPRLGPTFMFTPEGECADRPARKRTGLEELDFGISAEGVVDTIAEYDSADRPTVVSLLDAQHEVVRRVLFSRDDGGRISQVQVLVGNAMDAAMKQALTLASPEDRDRFQAILAAVMPANVFLTVDYTCDDRDRVAALRRTMGALSEESVVYTYDEMDNVVEEHTRSSSRDGSVGDDGRLRTSNESFNEEWVRYEYRYDDRGNWIERIVLSRHAPERECHRLSIERRTITYFGG